MEVIQDNQTQLYEVLFNGAPVLGCFDDTDCANPRICAYNETWSAFPSQCTCDVSVGYGGAYCNELGSGILITIVIMSFTIIVSLAALFANFISLIRNMRLFNKERVTSNLNVTLIISTITCAVGLVAETLILNNSAGFPTRNVPAPGSDPRFPKRIVRLQQFEAVHVSMMIVAFALTTLSMFFLSLVWISVAIKFERLSAKQGQIVEKVCLAYLVFTLAVVLPLALVPSTVTVSAVLVIIITFILAVCFAVASYKIRKLRIERGENIERHAQGSHQQNLGYLLLRIDRTALMLSVLCLAATVTLAVFGFGPDRRPSYEPPVSSKLYREVAYRVAILFFTINMLVVTEHLTWTVRMKIKRRFESSSTTGGKGSALGTMNHDESTLGPSRQRQTSAISTFQQPSEAETNPNKVSPQDV